MLTEARADQGGTAFWLSGQFASGAAVPSAPGWSTSVQIYYYDGSSGADKSFPIGSSISTGLSTRTPEVFVQPGYATKELILGGQLYIGLGWGYARNIVDASASISLKNLGTQFDLSDGTTGDTDLYPYTSLSWTKGNNNWMAYLTGDIPTGSYSDNGLANIGMGHASIDAGGGYTYLDNSTGLEFSAVLGVTYNWKNTTTDVGYKSGNDVHLDFAASRFFASRWEAGVAGYAYGQLSADSYATSGAVGALRQRLLGSHESRVYAAGPEIAYTFPLAGQSTSLNVRGYKEFGAVNRTQGKALFITASIPF